MDGRAEPLTAVVIGSRSLQGDVERAGLVVVGASAHLDLAAGLVARLHPSAVLLGPPSWGEAGLAALEQIMAASPRPVVVLGALPVEAARAVLAAGGVDVLDPAVPLPVLAERLRLASRVRVIRHPRARLRAVPAPGRVRLVVVGASTGGPTALATLLGALPPDLEPAVLVVQHMAQGFLPGLAEWLGRVCPLPVRVGAAGTRLLPGTVTLAPDGSDLVVEDATLQVRCLPPTPGQVHVPAIDVTFASVAAALGPRAVGVVLTGMGRDGTAGLTAMHDRGAATIGQDEATCAVYGMPAAAFRAGAVDQELPLERIGPALLALLGRSA